MERPYKRWVQSFFTPEGRMGAWVVVCDSEEQADAVLDAFGKPRDGESELSLDQQAGLAGHRTGTGLPGLSMQREAELAQPGVHEPAPKGDDGSRRFPR